MPTYPVVGSPRDVVVADFNRDGKLDVAATIQLPRSDDEAIVVLLGNGDGTFQAPRRADLAVGMMTALSLASAGFNGDGRTDLAVANQLGKDVTVMSGSGAGSFPTRYSLKGGGRPRAVAADFDAHFRQDLAVIDLAGGVTLLRHG